MHTEFSRFIGFWAGSSLCLAYLVAVLVNSGVIRWGEGGATTVAYLCIILIFLDFGPLREGRRRRKGWRVDMDQVELKICSKCRRPHCRCAKRLQRSKAYAFEAMDVTSFHQKAKASTR